MEAKKKESIMGCETFDDLLNADIQLSTLFRIFGELGKRGALSVM